MKSNVSGKILLIIVLSVALIGAACTARASAPTTHQKLPLFSAKFKAALSKVLSRKGAQHVQPRDMFSDAFSGHFMGEGPESLETILDGIDYFIGVVNSNSASGPCLSVNPPVPYSITVFSGTHNSPKTLQMYGQCFEQLNPQFPGDPGLVIIGTDGVGNTYVYMANGQSNTVAIQNSAGSIHVWYGVGYGNSSESQCSTWYGCTYGVVEAVASVQGQTLGLQSNPDFLYYIPMTVASASNGQTQFEISAAGFGDGFCGIQMAADGSNLWVVASPEGPDQTCTGPQSGCYDQSLYTPAAGGICSAADPFTLPALGRMQTGGMGASLYPDSPGVLLNGTSTDDLHFVLNLPNGTTGMSAIQPGQLVPKSPPVQQLDLPFPAATDSNYSCDWVFIPQSFSSNAVASLGLGVHNGIHYNPSRNYVQNNPLGPFLPYYTMASGTIVGVGYEYGATGEGGQGSSWNVNVTVEYPQGSSSFAIGYGFETMQGTRQDTTALQAQLENLTSLIPDSVKAEILTHAQQTLDSGYNVPVNIPVNYTSSTDRDLIGYAISYNRFTGLTSYPIVHLSTIVPVAAWGGPAYFACMQPYLTNDALSRTNTMLHNATPIQNPPIPDWQPCYGNMYF